jgi:hypothetical protein
MVKLRRTVPVKGGLELESHIDATITADTIRKIPAAPLGIGFTR